MQRFRGLSVVLFSAFLASALPACSGGSEDEGTQPVCNELVNDGPEVRYTLSTEEPPIAIGGMIVDGTYELTALNLYGVDTVPDRVARAVFEIEGTTMEQVGEIDGSESRYTSKYSISGTTLRIHDSCPVESLDESEFTATPTDLRYILPSSNGTFEMVLTRR